MVGFIVIRILFGKSIFSCTVTKIVVLSECKCVAFTLLALHYDGLVYLEMVENAYKCPNKSIS